MFDGSESDFEAYESAEPKQQELIWRAQTAQMKLSTFAEEFFRRVSRDTGTTMLLRKGTLHELVSHCSPDELNGEVSEKLDAIHVLLDRSQDLG